MTTRTVLNLDGEYERVTLPAPHFTFPATGAEHFTGVWITALYSGPRTGRKFARTWSIWQSRNGHGVRGETHRELDEAEYLEYCERVGCEPVNVAATEA